MTMRNGKQPNHLMKHAKQGIHPQRSNPKGYVKNTIKFPQFLLFLFLYRRKIKSGLLNSILDLSHNWSVPYHQQEQVWQNFPKSSFSIHITYTINLPTTCLQGPSPSMNYSKMIRYERKNKHRISAITELYSTMISHK